MDNAFIQRLKTVIEYYNLSPSSFADQIEVQRSSISHLLNGRNRPSLDFVLRVIKKYPEVNLYWFLNGKGSFPSRETPIAHQSPNFKTLNAERKPIRIVAFYDDGTFESFEPKKYCPNNEP